MIDCAPERIRSIRSLSVKVRVAVNVSERGVMPGFETVIRIWYTPSCLVFTVKLKDLPVLDRCTVTGPVTDSCVVTPAAVVPEISSVLSVRIAGMPAFRLTGI